MGRLFDAESEEKQAAAIREDRERTRRRAQEVDEALAELEETDEASLRLRESLAQAQGVTAIVYQEFRKPGGKWMIEHSAAGKDYLFQLHPLRPPLVQVRDIIGLVIGAMDVIYPRSQQIFYAPPNPQYKLQFYTIKVENLVGVPGWREAVERTLNGLSAIDAWPRPERG